VVSAISPTPSQSITLTNVSNGYNIIAATWLQLSAITGSGDAIVDVTP
jgi:hypothetical protein